MNANLWYITNEISFLFEKMNLQLSELLNKLEGVFWSNLSIKVDFIADCLCDIWFFVLTG